MLRHALNNSARLYGQSAKQTAVPAATAALVDNNALSRSFHVSAPSENAFLIGGLSVAATAISAKYVLKAWEAYKNRPVSKMKPRYRSLYKGGFDDEMSRKEAACILGVRESASADRIKERHRTLLRLNHPDTGGSTFIASKVNEAKDVLLKPSSSSRTE